MKVIFHNKLCPHRVYTHDYEGQTMQRFMPCDGRECGFYQVMETDKSITAHCENPRNFTRCEKYYAQKEDGDE